MKRSRPVEFEIEPVHRPLYARMLRLRHLTPSGFLCFVFLEGAVALGILLALAELVSWWGVLVLPFTVALMVKLNDFIAALLTQAAAAVRPARPTRPAQGPTSRPAAEPAVVRSGGPGEATTRLPRVVDAGQGPITRPWAERLDAQQQWARQSATRRYE